ncbi:MAG: hypothetical protein QY325_13715 [Flavobacteriales bacterium]|nr:MAG: hypothetical protein QY325_13715 [Flavobacteriales bacterium]
MSLQGGLRRISRSVHGWWAAERGWCRLREERERLWRRMSRSLRKPDADAARREAEFAHLQRVEAVYKELRQRRVLRNRLLLLCGLMLLVGLLLRPRESSTTFQLKGRFSSVLFRTTTDLSISSDEGAPWVRRAVSAVVDTTWSYKYGTPFPKRGRLVLTAPGGEVVISHLKIPAGTFIRLQRDGNTSLLRMLPAEERREDLSVSLLGHGGALVRDGDSTTFPGGVELLPEGNGYHVIQLVGLDLELPCLAVDSVRFVRSNWLNPEDMPRASTLAASLVTGAGDTRGIELLQHDTLAIRLDGRAPFCLRTDSLGLQVTQTGRALGLMAGQAWRQAEELDRRRLWLTAQVADLPAEWRAFLLTILVSVFGYLVLGNRGK